MGFTLFPGHRQNNNTGWQEVGNYRADLLDNIRLGGFELGNFGEGFSDGPDKYAGHYSIPNPWAAAYLFHMVLKTNDHPLRGRIIELMLNVLNDFHCYRKLSIMSLTENSCSGNFRAFWDQSPEFLKFNDRMYFFVDSDTNCVAGGLSRTTLVWSAQHYMPVSSMEEMQESQDLCSYLKFIKAMRMPQSLNDMEYNVFWAQHLLGGMVGKGREHDDYEAVEECPLEWVVRAVLKPDSGKYRVKDWLVFDRNAMEDNRMTGRPNPPKFIDELKKMKSGGSLPMGMGEHKWTLFDSLFEGGWIRLNHMHASPQCQSYHLQFLYPFNPKYLVVGFEIDKIRSGTSYINEKSGYANNIITQGNPNPGSAYRFRHDMTGRVYEDSRSIAVWPPFPSKYIANYIIEYDVRGVQQNPELEFYTENGTWIGAGIVRNDNEVRVYKLNDSGVFPSFIRFSNRENLAGFLKVKSLEIPPGPRKVVVGFDFGSTHTSIAYSVVDENGKPGEPRLLTFRYSSPLIIADDESRHGLLDEFIPQEVHEDPPQSEKFFKSPITATWSPLRTIWKTLNLQTREFLAKGIIPLAYDPETYIELETVRGVKENLKWTSDASSRNGFLEHIINMIVVECEAMGYMSIVINWSFPRSFSNDEKNTITNFYRGMNERFRKIEGNGLSVKIRERGYSEASRAMQYFIQKDRFVPKRLSATVDIGGGTSDITFFEIHDAGDYIQWEDSVKIGGDDIANLLKEPVDTINYIRAQRGLNVYEGKRYNYNQLIRTWPLVHTSWDNEIANFIHGNKNIGRFLEKLALFYGGICYYIGMHLRRNGDTGALMHIAFAGNGIQFLRICSGGNDLNVENIPEWFALFRAMVAKGQGIDASLYSETDFIFSRDPKKEVAFGLTFAGYGENGEDDDPNEKEPRKMFGLDLIKRDGGPGRSWDQWEDLESNHILSNFDIDFSGFESFLQKLYRTISEIAGKGKRSQFYPIKRPNAFGLDQTFRNGIANELARRGNAPLATPLFFSALKNWITIHCG